MEPGTPGSPGAQLERGLQHFLSEAGLTLSEAQGRSLEATARALYDANEENFDGVGGLIDALRSVYPNETRDRITEVATDLFRE